MTRIIGWELTKTPKMATKRCSQNSGTRLWLYLVGTFTLSTLMRTSTCKFPLYLKDSKSYCLLVLFHSAYVRKAKPPGLYLAPDPNETTTYIGTDGLTYTVPRLMVKKFDRGMVDIYNYWWRVQRWSGTGATN